MRAATQDRTGVYNATDMPGVPLFAPDRSRIAEDRCMLSLETPRETGRRIYAASRPAIETGRRTWARAAPWAPLVAVALLLLLAARTFYFQLHFDAKPGWKAYAQFADIGTISGRHLGLNGLVRNNNPTGFDGQFYYFMALDPSQPFICAHHPPNCALDRAFGIVRAERHGTEIEYSLADARILDACAATRALLLDRLARQAELVGLGPRAEG